MRRAQRLLRHLPRRAHPLAASFLERLKHPLGHAHRDRLVLGLEPVDGRRDEVGDGHAGVEVGAPARLARVELRCETGPSVIIIGDVREGSYLLWTRGVTSSTSRTGDPAAFSCSRTLRMKERMADLVAQ